MNQHTSLFSPQTLVDPFDYYRQAHASGTAIEHVPEMNAHVVYSYDLCSEATMRPQDFSNDFASLMGATDPEIDAILAEGWDNPPTLLTN